jgi:predicted Fe-S protein YdhL (DUF1289 family)
MARRKRTRDSLGNWKKMRDSKKRKQTEIEEEKNVIYQGNKSILDS